MNAHAQQGSELFLQGTGLSFFVGDAAGDETPAGWTEMLSTMTDAFGEIVEHAATVRQAADTTGTRISEFDHPLAIHAELRYRAERCLELMRQQLVGSLAVISAHAEAGGSTAVGWPIGQPPA